MPEGEAARILFEQFYRILSTLCCPRQVKFHQHGGKELDYAPPIMTVTGKVKHSKPIQRRDFEYLASVAKATPKVTIPSPTMLHFRAGREGISEAVYPDMADFFADVGQAYREEIGDLVDAGCRYLQLDDTNLAYLCDETQRENARRRGMDPNEAPRLYASLINSAIRDVPEDMVTAVHLCRGNFRSSWAAEGGYEPVAEVMFNELNINSFFLEYDDARSGDFRPLRFVPKGNKRIVRGIITSKFGRLEDKGDLKRRLEEAAKYMPMEQICISAQCGFASHTGGNLLSEDEQYAKLRLAVEVADEVWGES